MGKQIGVGGPHLECPVCYRMARSPDSRGKRGPRRVVLDLSVALHRPHGRNRRRGPAARQHRRRFRDGSLQLRATVPGIRVRGDSRERGDLPGPPRHLLHRRPLRDLVERAVPGRCLPGCPDLYSAGAPGRACLRQPFDPRISRRALRLRPDPHPGVDLLAVAALLPGGPAGRGPGDVRDDAGSELRLGVADHRRCVDDLRGARRRPRRHPDRRDSGRRDGRAGDRHHRALRGGLRRGWRIFRPGAKPEAAGPESGPRDQSDVRALPLVVGDSRDRPLAPAPGSAPASGQQDLGSPERSRSDSLRDLWPRCWVS